MNETVELPTATAWGEPLPDGCTDERGVFFPDPAEHLGYSDFDGECRECGYGTGIPTDEDCDSCQ